MNGLFIHVTLECQNCYSTFDFDVEELVNFGDIIENNDWSYRYGSIYCPDCTMELENEDFSMF